jgi:hypothetical protein
MIPAPAAHPNADAVPARSPLESYPQDPRSNFVLEAEARAGPRVAPPKAR